MKELWILSTSFLFAGSAAAKEWFQKDIDYWNEGLQQRALSIPEGDARRPQSEMGFSGATLIRSSDSEPFSWEQFMNPRNPEFWDDGGTHIPPRPFREVMLDPTPENIRRYNSWIGARSKLLARFNRAMEEEKLKELAASVDFSRIEAFYVFADECPYCVSDTGTVSQLRKIGLGITPVRLYGDSSELHPDSSDLSALPQGSPVPEATPTWILRLPGGGLLSLQGKQTPLQILQTFRTSQSQEETK